MKAKVQERVHVVFSEVVGVYPEQVTDDSKLRDFADVDYLDEVLFLMDLEDEFSISIDDDLGEKIPSMTLREIIAYIFTTDYLK